MMLARQSLPSFCLLLLVVPSQCNYGVSYYCNQRPSGNDCVETNLMPESLEHARNNREERATVNVVNTFIMTPFNDSYPFSKLHIEPAVYQALEDDGADLCSHFSEKSWKQSTNRSCYNITFIDTKCNEYEAIVKAADIHQSLLINSNRCDASTSGSRAMNLLIGMTCDEVAESICVLASKWNMSVILPGARSTRFDDKLGTWFNTVTRTGHSASDVGRFVSRLRDHLSWKSIHLIYSTRNNHGAPVHDDVHSDCPTIMAGIEKQLKAQVNCTATIYSTRYDTDDELVEDARDVLNEIESQSSASVWCVGRDTMRYVMDVSRGIVSEEPGQGFVYLDLYNTNNTYEWNHRDDQSYYPTVDVTFKRSDNGLRRLQMISLLKPETAEYENFSDTMKKEITAAGVVFKTNNEFVNPFVAQYYNTFRLITSGVMRMLPQATFSWLDGQSFSHLLRETTFESVDGTVKIDENGDRRMDYVLMDLNENTGMFEVVLMYHGYNDSIEVVKENEAKGGISAANVAIIVLLVLFIVATTLIFCLIRRRRMRKYECKNILWRINLDELQWCHPRQFVDMPGIARTARKSNACKNQRETPRFPKTAVWHGKLAAYKEFEELKRVSVNQRLVLEMENLLLMDNPHICKFFGAGMDGPVFTLTEYCSRGSVLDLLSSSKIDLDDDFKNYLISDIARGMSYLHRSSIKSHGNLKASNCLVDERYCVKIADFGPSSIREKLVRTKLVRSNDEEYCKSMLWTAPELLRQSDPPVKGTQEGDVYSFAIVMHEILYNKGVFYLGEDSQCSHSETVRRLITQDQFRPTLNDDDEVVLGHVRKALLQRCWYEIPRERPNFEKILAVLKTIYRQKHIIDNLVRKQVLYSEYLEERVSEVTENLHRETRKVDDLLGQMMPASVAERLKIGEKVLPERFDCATIYFSDFVGFNDFCQSSKPIEIVKKLHDLYTRFDQIIDSFEVYKVETISDSYVVVSGLPKRNGNQHASEIAKMALQVLKNFTQRHDESDKMKLRIGIHSGPVVAGVVGHKMPRYCLFGDTVNTAARLEHTGEALKIQVSSATKKVLEEQNGFHLSRREDGAYLKGIGECTTWWLDGAQQ